MADIAFIFHWPPSEMDAMSPEELVHWWGHATERWKSTHPTRESNG